MSDYEKNKAQQTSYQDKMKDKVKQAKAEAKKVLLSEQQKKKKGGNS